MQEQRLSFACVCVCMCVCCVLCVYSVYGRVLGCVAGGRIDARAGTVFWVGAYVCVRVRVRVCVCAWLHDWGQNRCRSSCCLLVRTCECLCV